MVQILEGGYMIKNMEERPKFLDLLVEAPYAFHLVGSRFFGHPKAKSDWDFFVDARGPGGESGLMAWLKSHGFKPESRDEYGGKSIHQTWRHRKHPLNIIVVYDVRFKSTIQEILNSPEFAPTFTKMSKRNRDIVWQIAEAAHEVGRQSRLVGKM